MGETLSFLGAMALVAGCMFGMFKCSVEARKRHKFACESAGNTWIQSADPDRDACMYNGKFIPYERKENEDAR